MSAKTKMALFGLGAAYCLYYYGISGPGQRHFIDSVDLVIHEAKRLVRSPEGN